MRVILPLLILLALSAPSAWAAQADPVFDTNVAPPMGRSLSGTGTYFHGWITIDVIVVGGVASGEWTVFDGLLIETFIVTAAVPSSEGNTVWCIESRTPDGFGNLPSLKRIVVDADLGDGEMTFDRFALQWLYPGTGTCQGLSMSPVYTLTTGDFSEGPERAPPVPPSYVVFIDPCALATGTLEAWVTYVSDCGPGTCVDPVGPTGACARIPNPPSGTPDLCRAILGGTIYDFTNNDLRPLCEGIVPTLPGLPTIPRDILCVSLEGLGPPMTACIPRPVGPVCLTVTIFGSDERACTPALG